MECEACEEKGCPEEKDVLKDGYKEEQGKFRWRGKGCGIIFNTLKT